MKKSSHSSWYPVSLLGVVITTAYAMVPPYIVYAQTTDSFPETLRIPLISAMGFVLVCMLISRYTNQKPFHKKR